jgi:glycosyltransferase involved in cell wall biosynthesis
MFLLMYERLHGITFFSSRPHRVHEAFVRSVDAELYLFKFDGKTKKPYLQLFLSPWVKKPRSDVYICESPLYLFTVIPQKLLKPRLKVILMATSPFRMYFNRGGAPGRLFFKWALGRADGVIAVSDYVAGFYRGVMSRPVKVAYPYADIGHFDGHYADLRSKNIVFLGKMMPYKGVDILLDAFRMIREKSPESRLYLMGHFKDGALKLPDIEGLTVAGKVDDPLEYFSKACIYMHPAREEAFGISIIEACAAGLLPIVSAYTGAAEIIRPICPELVVASLDPADYCERALAVMEWGLEEKERVSSKLRDAARGFGKEERIRAFRDTFDELIEEIGDVA